MFNYLKYLKLIDDYSEEKVIDKTLCSWYGNTILSVLIVIFINDFLFYTFYKINYYIYVFIYILVLIGLFVYISTRKSAVGISNSHFIYVKYKHFGVKIKDFEEIKFDKIRNINVRRFLGYNIIFMSFISSKGKLEKVRFYFTDKYIGFGSDDIMTSRKNILDKLIMMQKVLDRGDF